MDNILKIVKSLEESSLLIKDVSETIKKKKQNNKNVDFLACYLIHWVLIYYVIY